MKNVFLILLVILGCSCENRNAAYSESQSDSIAIYIERAQNENDTIYSTKAFELLTSQPNTPANREYIFRIAEYFFQFDQLKKFGDASAQAYKLARASNDTLSLAKAYRYKAEYYKMIGANDSAFQSLQNAEKIYIKIGDNVNRGKVLYKKAILQYDGNDILGADLSMSQAYNLLKKTEEKQLIYQTLSMTGIIANALEDYEKAIEFHNKALDIVEESNLDPSLYQKESTLNNLGGVYQRIGQDKEAIKMFTEALKGRNDFRYDMSLYALLLDNLAYSKFKLKEFDSLPELFFKALQIRDSMDLSSSVIVSQIHLSEYYSQIRDTAQAKNIAKQSLLLAKETRSPVNLLLALKQISSIDHADASRYSAEYIKINDSLQQAERKSRDKFVRLQLETDEIASEKDKLEEQNRTLLYFFVVTFMIGLLLFIIRAQRARNRELLLKQAQQKANEEIYNLMISQQSIIEESRVQEKKRIAQELHDGVLGRLFGTRLNLDSLNKSSNDSAVEQRSNYLRELRNIEQDIREISHDLNREKYVIINNFLAIINNLIEEQRNLSNAKINLVIDEIIKWETISNVLKIHLYRIIQEGLQNINKYASATSISIQVKLQNEELMLSISDDGVGFDTSSRKKGIGLQNMVSRTNEMNGTIDIKSKKGKGSLIIIAIPLLKEHVIE